MMENLQSLKLNYSLKIFDNSEDKEFLEALNIYIKSVSRSEKTSTNEITWCIDNRNVFDKFVLFFCGLKLNGKIIGYAEVALIKSTRYITIDYLIVNEKYRTHSAFYTFLLLLINFFSTEKLDYDFIGIELLTDDNGNLSKEELTEFELEGFRVLNTLYIQPCLEAKNYDSQHKALLLIYQRNSDNKKIKKDTFLEIVRSIYFDYYYEWDINVLNINNSEKSMLYNKLQELLKIVENSLSEDLITLNGYPFSKMSGENKVIPNDKTVNKKLWQSLFFTMVFGIFVLGLILAIKKMNVELIIVGVVFVLFLFTWLSFLSFSENKAYSLLSKIPFLSKFFENIE